MNENSKMISKFLCINFEFFVQANVAMFWKYLLCLTYQVEAPNKDMLTKYLQTIFFQNVIMFNL